MTPEGLKMDSGKVSDVEQWQVPQPPHDFCAFIGFSNFHRRFIEAFSQIIPLLMASTKKDTPFVWSTICDISFKRLNKSFVSAPILHHFDPERKIMVETDASDVVVARVLLQYDDNNILHPVVYFSSKHSPAEINYEIYDKELLEIVWAFKEWRPLLEGSPYTIEVISDYRNLTYFTSNCLLNYCQT
jgi:hypothetical protein